MSYRPDLEIFLPIGKILVRFIISVLLPWSAVRYISLPSLEVLFFCFLLSVIMFVLFVLCFSVPLFINRSSCGFNRCKFGRSICIEFILRWMRRYPRREQNFGWSLTTTTFSVELCCATTHWIPVNFRWNHRITYLTVKILPLTSFTGWAIVLFPFPFIGRVLCPIKFYWKRYIKQRAKIRGRVSYIFYV